MLESFTIATFALRIGESFLIRITDAQTIELTLSTARELTPHTIPTTDMITRIPFSLLFLGPSELGLSQGTYRLEHAQLGIFDLFIVPVGVQGDQMQYEAVFT